MPHADFVHLRVHSAYSLSEGAIKVKELVKLCQDHAMPAVAITDTGNLFGAMEFALAAASGGVQPIIGCQINLTHHEDQADPNPTRATPPDQLVLLAQTDRGYRNLIKLVSRAYLESDATTEPQIDLAAVEGHTDGLIALTGGPAGPVGRALAHDHRDAAERALARLAALFPGRLYVELMRHAGDQGALEARIEPALIELADAHDLPLVATNDCFFPDADMYDAHDALLCIAEGRYVTETDRRRVSPDHSFKSPAEMRQLFADLPEAVDNTLVIAQRCSFLLKPIKPILPAYGTTEGRSEDDELRAQAADGLERRLAQILPPDLPPDQRAEQAKPYWDRLDYELGVIIKMGFPGYFLIVSDFMKWTRAQNIPVGVRGSGATSIVAWAMDITSLDPLRFNLVFERFLNPERVSMPDFDIDFCQERRDEVIHYVQDKYGHDRVAQIITFGKLQARAVLRDVGRVLQLPFGLVDKLCKMVPNNPAQPITLKQALVDEPLLQQKRDEDEAIARLIDIALKLEGLYRHASTHAAGVVIGDRPLDELLPLYRDPRSDMPVTQFNMKFVEQAGLVKFDFLGLKTLTVIAKSEDLINAAEGREGDARIRAAEVPFDNPITYEMLGRGESTGIFQLESSGMRDLLRKMKPDRIEDLIALVALYRPGPMDSIPVYIACKHGREAPSYAHPTLEPILNETFGVMTYQEDVMRIARELAGYSLGEADLLRRAMGKKIKEEMDKQRVKFVGGAETRGISPDTANQIFDQAAKFAGYGFNKGHAAAYAQVAFQTAWLKANHTVAFLAASMTLDLGNTDKLNLFRQELVRLGVKLLPPDINRSGVVFTLETLPDGAQAIRYALAAVKGVGSAAMQAIVDERARNGPYTGLFDLARRLELRTINRRQLETLAAAGALDSLAPNRARTFAAIETLLRYAHAAADDRTSGQSSLFGGPSGATTGLSEPPLPETADWDPLERLKHEFEAIGFYLSAHPLDAYQRALTRLKVVRAADLPAEAARGLAGNRVRLAGVIVARQQRKARSGNRFAFVQLSDPSGVYEVTVFSEVLATCRELLETGTPVFVTADVQQQEGDLRLTAQEVRPLEEVVATVAEGVSVLVRDARPVPSLKELIAGLDRGRGRITVVVEAEALREVEIELPGSYALTPTVRGQLRTMPGVVEVAEL